MKDVLRCFCSCFAPQLWSLTFVLLQLFTFSPKIILESKTRAYWPVNRGVWCVQLLGSWRLQRNSDYSQEPDNLWITFLYIKWYFKPCVWDLEVRALPSGLCISACHSQRKFWWEEKSGTGFSSGFVCHHHQGIKSAIVNQYSIFLLHWIIVGRY